MLMLMQLHVHHRRQIITEKDCNKDGGGDLSPTSCSNFDPSMSTTKISSREPSLPPRGSKVRFYPEVI